MKKILKMGILFILILYLIPNKVEMKNRPTNSINKEKTPLECRKEKQNKWTDNINELILKGTGWRSRNGKEYYFENNEAYKGIKQVGGRTFYFDEETGIKQYGIVKKDYYELVLNKKTGEFIKKQYTPPYYNQKEESWKEENYGMGTLGGTGCAPTSMAMIFSSLKEQEIPPTTLAAYLYNETNTYNKLTIGTNGYGLPLAATYYGIHYKGISTKEELINELKIGRIVYAAMQEGIFSKPNSTHAIVLFRYKEENETYTYDPLERKNNTWIKIDTIWEERSREEDDLQGGYAMYSLYP